MALKKGFAIYSGIALLIRGLFLLDPTNTVYVLEHKRLHFNANPNEVAATVDIFSSLVHVPCSYILKNETSGVAQNHGAPRKVQCGAPCKKSK